jgi:putative endonuclease
MWFLYILKARDRSLYTGITVDISRRLKEHNQGKGSRSLRGKLPVKLVFQERFRDRSSALKREAAIKRWPRAKKLALVRGASFKRICKIKRVCKISATKRTGKW